MRPHPATSVLFRILRLVASTHLFFFLAVILVVAVFVLGNYQDFLPESQILLLRIISAFGVLALGSGLWYVVALTIWMIRRRHLMLLRLVSGLLSTTLSLVLVVAASTLQTIAGPV